MLILLAPAAPHFTEEMWEAIGEKYSIHNQHYPEYDAKKTVLSTVEIAVQVNSKIVSRIEIETGLSNDDILKVAKADADTLSFVRLYGNHGSGGIALSDPYPLSL